MGVESDADVYIKYRDDLLRYATSLVGPDRAEDVVSTVVLRTMRGQGLAELDRPHAYLMKSVLNESRSVWRRVSTVPLSEADSRHLPDEIIETLDALWRLPVRQRAAAFLFYWEDRSVTEIAELMGVRDGTVKRYLHNARQRLKRSLR
jgi:RNA polymerase sigma-70 factor (ECF subfamily)